MIMGEPKVSRDVYINHIRIRLAAMPILSPMADKTPKAFHSIKFLKRFTMLI